ncbi:MAG: HNH endonuclease [Rhodoferax sp.]|nr:HNH endonuclease [Rhodoferax sp.]
MPQETKPRNDWTREQVLAGLHIYLQLNYGQLHARNAQIKALAGWIGRTANSVALKLGNLASLDPAVLATGRKGMMGASKIDKAVWKALLSNWDATVLEAASVYKSLAVGHGVEVAEAEALDLALPPAELGRTRAATVQVRVNQARFRTSVLVGYNSTCCISGLQNESLLIASHIVPWSEDTRNRLNPQNGLCLSALHDRAYDQGLITVLPDYTVRVSPKLKAKTADAYLQDALLRFDKAPIRMPSRLAPAPEFLSWHATRFGFL